jgi:ribosome recycling factor
MYNLETFKKEAAMVEEWLSKEFGQLHTGRAAPVLLDGVQVESYGSYQPLKNVASVSIEDAKTLRIVPWDKSQIKDIERTLYASNLGFSIAVDDAGIRVIIPALTTESRERLAKIAKERLEDARITIRKARETMLDELKAMDLPEDTHKRAKDEVQKLVDAANANLETYFKKKEAEIMS